VPTTASARAARELKGIDDPRPQATWRVAKPASVPAVRCVPVAVISEPY
jgi:hypothetical protein